MKTILAFGDNLTWGFDPMTEARHAYEDRWTSVLEEGLGSGVRVIAEGLAGRTTAFDDLTGQPERNGARILPTLLATHTPLDVLVIMLGNSELRGFMGRNAIGSMYGMQRLIEIVRTFPYHVPYAQPPIVVVAPPPLTPTEHPELSRMFEGRIEESVMLAEHYKRLCANLAVTFFNGAWVSAVSPVDGAHLDATNNRALGRALLPVVKQLLEQ
jgi:lysophospholipase L1-like esterase